MNIDPDDPGFYDGSRPEPWRCHPCVMCTRKCKICGMKLVAHGGPLKGWVECQNCRLAYHVKCLRLALRNAGIKCNTFYNSVTDIVEKGVNICQCCVENIDDLDSESEPEWLQEMCSQEKHSFITVMKSKYLDKNSLNKMKRVCRDSIPFFTISKVKNEFVRNGMRWREEDYWLKACTNRKNIFDDDMMSFLVAFKRPP